jgi:hypothetical protein
MAANTTPIFIIQGNIGTARLAAYNAGTTTATITAGTSYDLVIGGTDGTRVDGVRVTAAGEVAGATTLTPALKTVRIFICDVGNTNHRLITDTALSATVISNTTARSVGGGTSLITFDQPIILKSTQKLIVTMTAGSTAFLTGNEVDVVAYAGDY